MDLNTIIWHPESFEGCVGGTLGGTDTSFTVFCVLISEGELSEISADHVEFDFDDVEGFAIVDCNIVPNHVGHDDGVPKVGFDGGWLLTGLCVLFSLFAFQVESIVSMLDF